MLLPTPITSSAAVLLAFCAAAAWSQPVPSVAPAASAASAAAARPAKAHVQVIEDDNVRIEESRVRGQPSRITVHNKVGTARSYEIIVPAGGKDPSQDRGASGQRAWSIFGF